MELAYITNNVLLRMVSYAPVTWEAGVSLVIILGGILVYHVWSELVKLLRFRRQEYAVRLPTVHIFTGASFKTKGRNTITESETGPLLSFGKKAAV